MKRTIKKRPTKKRPRSKSISNKPFNNYAAFKDHWKDCEDCDLCNTRRRVVLARGKLPAEVMFIGEAPGENEDVFGKPFVGPAGKSLDVMIKETFRQRGSKFTYVITNLVACIPRKVATDNADEIAQSIRQPKPAEIKACSTRLIQFIHMARPCVFVAVGSISAKHLPKFLPENYAETPIVSIIHPAAIMRMHEPQLSIAYQRNIAELYTIWDHL
jgi:uracil-DNA glycosylase